MIEKENGQLGGWQKIQKSKQGGRKMEKDKYDKYKAQKKYMAKLKKFCFRLPPEEWEAFRESCERAGSTPTTEIRKFIKNAENDNPV